MKKHAKKLITFILTWCARRVLKKYSPKIVAVTGSVGKTSTKDAIYAALTAGVSVRKSEKSYNSEIGIPLTILGLSNAWSDPVAWVHTIGKALVSVCSRSSYPEWLVLEIGADRPGDIERARSLISPTIVVFTAMSKVPAHVEFFPSAEAVFKEKVKMSHNLSQESCVVINNDDSYFSTLSKDFESRGVRVESYGHTADSSAVILSTQPWYDDGSVVGMIITVKMHDKEFQVHMRGSLGAHNGGLVASSLLVAEHAGISLDDACRNIASMEPPKGRQRILKGTHNSVIIDDTYNASPLAVEEALDTLLGLSTQGRKIAVLGDMLELGSYSVAEHVRLGELASGCDVLFAVGLRAQGYAEGARKAGMSEEKIYQCKDAREAGDKLSGFLQEGDTVLVKGSQGMRMERVVTRILHESFSPEECLVRQDNEWLEKE